MKDEQSKADDTSNKLKELQKDIASFTKPFEAIRKIPATRADAIDRLQRAAQQLPQADTVVRVAKELMARTDECLKVATRARREAFGKIEAEFIKHQRETKVPIREMHEGWRVGELEIQLRRDQASARALYNHQQVVDWQAIASPTDLEKLVERARQALQKFAIPEADLPRIFWSAYCDLRTRQEKKGGGHPTLLPIREFYREVRIALIRHELSDGKPDKKLSWAELPEWAFLYNLDRYHTLGDKVNAEQRLALQTGSQDEHKRGLAMTTNGLDPAQDHKTFCYVVPASRKS